MKTSVQAPLFNGLILPIILGLLIAVIAYANLNNRSLPLINSPRAALIAILIIGMTMCALGGIGQVGASGKWASPFAIAGYLLTPDAKRYVFVAIVNHPNAQAARPALDALLDWAMRPEPAAARR